MSGLTWIQTVRHSDDIPERIFRKSWFWKKNQQTAKSLKNFPVGKELKSVKAKSWQQKNCFPPAVSLRMLENFACFLSSADIFQNQHFVKILSKIPSECRTVWIQIRFDVLSGLIWVQTFCKCYQQTALAGEELSKLLRWYVGILKKHSQWLHSTNPQKSSYL